LRSPEAVMAALSAQLGGEPPPESEPELAKAAKRKPSAAAPAREERHAVEADQLKQSVRDIFRKLTSQLHPDREPDAAERARKTALMQRVNVAYAANDLLALLELQLEVEQIDQAELDEGRCLRENTLAPTVLARACVRVRCGAHWSATPRCASIRIGMSDSQIVRDANCMLQARI
jgi:hypothetical protein